MHTISLARNVAAHAASEASRSWACGRCVAHALRRVRVCSSAHALGSSCGHGCSQAWPCVLVRSSAPPCGHSCFFGCANSRVPLSACVYVPLLNKPFSQFRGVTTRKFQEAFLVALRSSRLYIYSPTTSLLLYCVRLVSRI